jgi:hypothetical protein
VVHGGVRLPQVGSSDKIKDISISITGAVDANLENSRFVIPAPIFIGINSSRNPGFLVREDGSWIPVFTGMTLKGKVFLFRTPNSELSYPSPFAFTAIYRLT